MDDASTADPGPELAKVLKFRVELERTRSVRYRTFADAPAFQREIDSHLRALVKGALSKVAVDLERLPLPLDLISRVEQAEARAKKKVDEAEKREKEQRSAAQIANERAQAQEARAEVLASIAATQAATAAQKGRTEKARQIFANAALGTSNQEVLHLAFEFYWRGGALNSAQEMLERLLAIGGGQPDTAENATPLSNLGQMYHIRGDLNQAEKLYRRALALDEQLKRRESAATDYGYLGLIYQARGDLDRAEKMHKKALRIEEQLSQRSRISNCWTNLGLISQIRGDFKRAEQRHRKALELAASPASAPAGVVTIPVVVHVVYKRPEENISDKQIKSQIAVLNQDYRARNANLSTVPFPFKPLVGDARIEFELATKTPDGVRGKGITRTKTNADSFGDDDRIKFRRRGGVDPWDPQRYLNIWVGALAGGLLSYSQFPGGAKQTDGVVVILSPSERPGPLVDRSTRVIPRRRPSPCTSASTAFGTKSKGLLILHFKKGPISARRSFPTFPRTMARMAICS